jgi:tRNA G18 (ribose-2'-O)-methylase SpoU
MTRSIIDDPNDPRLADYRELNERNLTRQSGKFIAEGDKVVERLVASRFEVASLLAEPAWADRLEPLLPVDKPIYVADRRVLEQTIGFNFHRGVLAAGLRGRPQRLSDVLECLPAGATIVVCPDVHDPSNLGTLIRTAAAFGVHAVVLGQESAYAFSRRVLRVSMGAVLQIPIIETADLASELESLRSARFEIVATVLDPTVEELRGSIRPERVALLFGSEGHGLGDQWLSHCDRQVTLPMRAGVDSLNVAIAAAVFLYHFMREHSN